MKIKSECFKLADYVLGIFIGFDINGIVVYASSEANKELGYTNLVGIDAKDIFPNINQLDSLVKESMGINIETVVYRENGSCFTANVKIKMVENESVFYLCTVKNIQDVEELTRQLELTKIEMEKIRVRRNEFVGNVTHELRTPVNGIKGHIVYLMNEGDLNNEQMQTMKIIKKCCINMEKIINNLLDFSKIEAGKFKLANYKFSFRETMQHVIDTNIQQANEKEISLSMNIAENIPDIMFGDSVKIEQIMDNLISNGIKFTTIGGVKIEIAQISSDEKKIEILVMVMDTGIGISQNDKDKLFKSFSQVDSTKTRNYGGTGLGLVVTKQLIEMMNGSIRFDSVPGKGSTFIFTIFIDLIENSKDIEKDTSKSEYEEKLKNTDLSIYINKGILLDNSSVYQWETKENKEELKANMDKIILCIEMNSWIKAEKFAERIKKLVENSNQEIKKQVLMLQMSVRKENYEKSINSYNELKIILKSG